jgi:hypothetical protein
MCVTCLGNNQHTHINHTCSSAPLHNLNKKYYTHINRPYNRNIIKQDKQLKRVWFNILDLLRYYDKRDMVKDTTHLTQITQL